ncbi:MAG: J domain-containing protein [Bacteroidetes bacterium]|nr:J domain-containing protein [Bacteroidota bacterium]MCL6101184.1 J domain-containing protein [Bacteroidota bacterium]
MKKFRTHYDNLKVARNAPIEVIQAAYRSLSQKYHPDKNPNNTESVRIMAIINHSYEVLSNENKRKLHDEWIKSQEVQEIFEPEIIFKKPYEKQPQQKVKKTKIPQKIDFKKLPFTVLVHLLKYGIFYLMLFALLFALFDSNSNNKQIETHPYKKVNPTPQIETPRYSYIRPNRDPYGRYWPTKAGYLTGQKIGNTKGYSKVTIDNSMNDSDVHAKLVYYDNNNSHPVREFYIPAFEKFTLNRIAQGCYDIRYRDLSTGSLLRSEYFQLEEKKTMDGTEYNNITMTLYKVQNGNMQTYSITESEF